MAKKARCDNGHWYDASKYESCPHCNTDVKMVNLSENKRTTSSETVADTKDDLAREQKESELILESKKKKIVKPELPAPKKKKIVKTKPVEEIVEKETVPYEREETDALALKKKKVVKTKPEGEIIEKETVPYEREETDALATKKKKVVKTKSEGEIIGKETVPYEPEETNVDEIDSFLEQVIQTENARGADSSYQKKEPTKKKMDSVSTPIIMAEVDSFEKEKTESKTTTEYQMDLSIDDEEELSLFERLFKRKKNDSETREREEEASSINSFVQNSTVITSEDEENLINNLINDMKKEDDNRDDIQLVFDHQDVIEPSTEQKAVSTTENDRTQAFYAIEKIEPVVGWLVCVKGIYFGQSFIVKAGRNMVGRSIDMDVCLMNDLSVSRDSHAIITYDPKSNEYGVQPGKGGYLIYKNNSPVYEHEALNTSDLIEIGKGTYMFVALCREGFTWATYGRINQ